MQVVQFALDVNYVNSFIAYDAHTRDAFMVDCGALEEQVVHFIKGEKLNLKFLLVTHSHYDHVNGVEDFKRAFHVPIYSATPNYDHTVREGDQIEFGRHTITVFETPGHISDGVSYYVEGVVFVGDAIFAGAVGGTASRKDFEEETVHVWNKILSLPDETVIYSGHGAPTLVGVERLFNPFFNRF